MGPKHPFIGPLKITYPGMMHAAEVDVQQTFINAGFPLAPHPVEFPHILQTPPFTDSVIAFPQLSGDVSYIFYQSTTKLTPYSLEEYSLHRIPTTP